MTGVVMGPKEVADVLRPHLQLHHTDPHDQHALNFLKDVATRLGLDHTPEVITHLAGLMREKGLVLKTGEEYPKMVTRKADSATFTVHSVAEEDRRINEDPAQTEPPAPRRLPPEMLPATDRDHPADISDKVPQTGSSENEIARRTLENDPVDDAGHASDLSRRVPRQFPEDNRSELDHMTDRAAAQGQRPLGSSHDRLGGHAVVDKTSGQNQDHFAEQEPGAAAMRQNFAGTDIANVDIDDGVTVSDDDPTHDQPAAKPVPDRNKRPV
jgi:hypothetical protein